MLKEGRTSFVVVFLRKLEFLVILKGGRKNFPPFSIMGGGGGRKNFHPVLGGGGVQILSDLRFSHFVAPPPPPRY